VDGHPNIMGSVTTVTASDDSIAIGGITVHGNVEGNINVGHKYEFEVHNIHGTAIFPGRKPSFILRPVKSQPPRSPRGFVGREKETAILERYISENETVLVHGPEGMGKTALVKKVANGLPATNMPDGVIFMEAVDEEGKLLGEQDIIQLLFDVLYDSDPPSKATSAVAGTLLSNTRPLVILDRYELPPATLNHIPDLFPKGSVVVTSRIPPTDDTFQDIKIEPLAHADAIQLLADKSGTQLNETSRPVISQICELVENVPLAIIVTANFVRNNKTTLANVVDKLKLITPPSRDRIQAAIERSYGLAYLLLNTAERDMLALATFAPGVSVDRAWLERMEGGAETLESLEALELLKANSPRLRLPDGMRQVIQSSRRDAQQLRSRLLEHLKSELHTRSLDFNYISDELGNILGLIHWASAEKRWKDVITLGRSVDPYLTLKGLWDAWEGVLQQILTAGQNLKDRAVEAWALHQLGSREIGVGSTPPAIKLLIHALRIRESIGDKEGYAFTLHNLRLILLSSRTDGTNGKSSMWDRLRYITRGWNPGLIIGWLILAATIVGLVANLLIPRVSLEVDDNDANSLSNLGVPVKLRQTISIKFLITNTGLLPIRGYASIVNEKIREFVCTEVSAIGNFNDSLEPNEGISCEAKYVITQSDLDQGSVTSEAQAYVFTREGSKPITSKPITVTVLLNPSLEEITLEISSDINPYERVGQPITYTYTVTNTGNQPLEGTILVDNGSATIICTNSPQETPFDNRLDPREVVTCTSTYFIIQADINNGTMSHTAIARIGDIESKDELTLYAGQVRRLSLGITANPNEYDSPGQNITYLYDVRNGGNTSLPGKVKVSDESASCPDSTTTGNFDDLFDPGEILSCIGVYTITQSDLDNGSVTKTVTAGAGDTVSERVEITIRALQRISLELSKFANPTTYNRVGENIAYTYVIRNNGNVTIPPTQFYITDDKIGSGTQFLCGPERTQLAPDETVTCTAVYTVVQADFGPRSVTNAARAVAEYPGYQITSEPAHFTITCPYPPSRWVVYTVEVGDTLSSISGWLGDVDVAGLQAGNCLGSASNIQQGQRLYIPRPPPPARIYGIVKNPQKQALGGIPVILMDSNGIVIRQTITDSNGTYTFVNLSSGIYRIFQVQRNLRWGQNLELNFTIIPDSPN
jgi:hypothetical protein